MLLPSALDCAPGIQPMRSVYTTSTMLSPPPSQHPPATSSANIFTTCRALQSLITTNLTSPHTIAKSSCAPPSLASPIALAPTSHPYTQRSTQAPRSQTPPRASRKRPRSDFDNEKNSAPKQEQEDTVPSTPKRQRLCPPTLPLSHERADFDALQEQAAAIPIPTTPNAPLRRRRPLSPHPNRFAASPSANPDNEDWCSPDSSALVSLILHKLRLRQSGLGRLRAPARRTKRQHRRALQDPARGWRGGGEKGGWEEG